MAITTYSDMIAAEALHDNDVFAVDQPDVLNTITEQNGVSRKISLKQVSGYMAESEAVVAKINHFVDIEKDRAETKETELDVMINSEISRATGVEQVLELALAGEIMRAEEEEFKKVDKAIAASMVESLLIDENIEDNLVIQEKLTRLDGSGSSVVPIAFPNATEVRAGIMTIEQVKAIAFLLAEVESIHGKTARLNAHDFMTDTPADDILTAYALAQLKLSDASKLPNLIGVRNICNAHLFVFNQESIQTVTDGNGDASEIIIPAGWTDQGLDTVNTATQGSLGVVQGSNDDWKARINEAGEIAVNTTAANGTAPGLSEDNFTAAEKTKLADLPAAAELQEQIENEVAAITERLDDHDEAVEALRTDKADKADVYTKTEIDGKISSALHYKGSVPTEGDLPVSGNVLGDVYNILDTGKNAAWDGTAWDNLSGVVSLTDYMTRQETGTAINAEAAAREAGDIALQINLGLANLSLANEITNRQTADQTLQANINAANAALTLEAQARTSSDEALALNIVTLGSTLTQEAADRTDADTALREELTAYTDQSLAAAAQGTSYAGTIAAESLLPGSGTVHGQYYEIDDMDITAPGKSGRAVWNAVTQPAQWDIRVDRQRVDLLIQVGESLGPPNPIPQGGIYIRYEEVL